MLVDIVNTETTVFSGDATFVRLPGRSGQLGILSGHIPLLTWLKEGTIFVRCTSGALETIQVSGGMVEVMPDAVTVLADTAVRTTGMDDERAAQASLDAATHLRQELDEMRYAAARAELLSDIERWRRA